MVQMLLDAGADPNIKTGHSVTALMAAFRNPVAAEKLLKAGADPRVKDSSGETVEDQACASGATGNLEVCTLVRQALRKE
jgi:ankyrin repeat protein